MENRIFYFILFFVSCTYTQAQIGDYEEKKIELPLLKITDSVVIQTIDSIAIQYIDVLIESRPGYNSYNNYFYYLSIMKDPEYDFYMINITLLPSHVIENINCRGVFYIKNRTVIVESSCNPTSPKGTSLFEITEDKKPIKYRIYKLAIREEFYSWNFSYGYKYMRFIDLPELFIQRLGFIKCK